MAGPYNSMHSLATTHLFSNKMHVMATLLVWRQNLEKSTHHAVMVSASRLFADDEVEIS